MPFDDDVRDTERPPTPVLEALASLNLAAYNAMREPEAFDLKLEEVRARIAFDGAVWEAEKRDRGVESRSGDR